MREVWILLKRNVSYGFDSWKSVAPDLAQEVSATPDLTQEESAAPDLAQAKSAALDPIQEKLTDIRYSAYFWYLLHRPSLMNISAKLRAITVHSMLLYNHTMIEPLSGALIFKQDRERLKSI